MNQLKLIILALCLSTLGHAQNVGINQASPTHSLHISPINNGDNPLRIDGLQSYSIGDTSLLIINNSTGIVKYITSSDLGNLLGTNNGGTDDQQLDSLTLNNYILTTYLEDGGNASVDLVAIRDSAINYLVNNSDTLFSQSFTDSIVSTLYNNADTLLHNNNFINNLRDSIDTDVDSVVLIGTILHIYENGNDLTANLNALSDNDSDPTNEYNTSFSLSGSVLQISDGGGTITADLAPLVYSVQTPVGAIFAFPTATPPSGYLVCNGQAVSRTTYNNLFSLIGTMYGAGDGSTTFNLPNYNGQFLRGFDNGTGVDPDAASRTDRGDGTTGDAVGTKQSSEIIAHSHTVNPPATNTSSAGAHTHTINPPATNTSSAGAHTHSIDPPNTNTSTNGGHNHSGRTGGVSTFDAGAWIPYDDNLSSNTVNETSVAPTTCGNPWNGHGTVGNFLGTMGCSRLNHTHTIATDGSHAHSVNIPAFTSSSSGNHTHSVDIAQFNSGSSGNHTHSVDIAQFNSGNNGGAETRPTNISVLWCIKF